MSKKLLAVFLLGLALVACQPPLPAIPNPITLDADTIQQLSAPLEAVSENLADTLKNPTANFELPKVSLPGGLNFATARLRPQAFSSSVLGDTSDPDADGIPTDKTTTYGGSESGFAMSGTSNIKDKGTGNAGFTTKNTNIRLEKGADFLQINSDSDYTPVSNGFSLALNFKYDVGYGGKTGSLEFKSTSSLVMDANGTDGTINYDMSIIINWDGRSSSIAAKGENLHFSRSCNQSFDSGKVTYTGANGQTIVHTYSGCTRPSSNQSVVDSIRLTPSSSSIVVGGTQQYTAQALDLSGGVIAGKTFTFASSSTGVATISSSGLAMGVAVGSSGMTASSGGITSNTATLNVTNAQQTPQLASIVLSCVATSIQVGATTNCSAVGKDSSGTTLATQPNITFASSQTPVATILSLTGAVTGGMIGNTNITASSGGITSNTVTITVTSQQTGPTLASIELTCTPNVIFIFDLFNCSVVGKDSSGNTMPNLLGDYSSSNTAVASTPSGRGSGQGQAVGTANITFSSGAITSNTVAITVQPKLKGINLTCTPSFIKVGETSQCTAIGYDASFQNLPFQPTFTFLNRNGTQSSNNIASVSSTGLVTGVSAGTSLITASLGNINTIVALNVFAASSNNYIAISAGFEHSLGLKSNGEVVGWGASVPATIPNGLAGVIAISAGFSHSLALKSNGEVVAWGDNTDGQTTIPNGLTGVTAIAAGINFSLALKNTGEVVAWGRNESGQTTIPSGLAGVTKIFAGGRHALAITNTGTLVAWGNNSEGQTTIPSGLTNVTTLAAGTNYALALKSNGTVVGWGQNSANQATVPGFMNGVTAISAGATHSLAVQGSLGIVTGWGDNFSGQLNIPNLTGVTAISAGYFHSLALKNDGTVFAWGSNGAGQLNVP